MEFTDQELVGEIRAGSEVAFERLVHRYRRMVFRIAYGFTGDGESAMDVSQETFLKVHAGLGGFRREGELKGWIARIAANEALNWRRTARRHPTCELDESALLEPYTRETDRVEARESREALHRSLSSLHPRQRLAIVLRYFQGMTAREIGACLDCSEQTARNTLFRALKRLRVVLSESERTLT